MVRLALIALLLAAPAPAGADAPAPARNGWLQHQAQELGRHLGRCWERRDAGQPLDWLAFGLLIGASAGLQFGTDPPRSPSWSVRNGFDDGIRSGLKGGSRGTRDAAADASDALLGALGATLVADWLYDCGREPEEEAIGLLWSLRHDGSWFLANTVATDVAKVAAGRERPYVRPCESNPSYIDDCDSGRDRNASFWSGHASTTATLAGLLCARHTSGPQITRADALLCGLPVAGALTTGLLRIVADRHYASDVLAGWASGALFGYLLPRRFSYDPLRRGMALRPLAHPRGSGLELVLTF